MSNIQPQRMKAPQGVTAATIEGHEYDVDSDGVIKVVTQAHVETLRRHGFTDHLEDENLAKDIDGMDREELIEFIEEHGGDVPDSKAKMKDLRKLARKTVTEKGA